ncbi:MAG: hypothetical protein JF611_01910 [Betaproteobacteria bacterium]|jgi:hypothetical protein|nr:hypothetical protein [Betaproteobacteria bacterium]
MEAALLSVTQTRDGVWSVNERGPSRVAIAYFPSKWGAMKHAVRVALAKPRCRVAVLERDGTVRLARDYDHGSDDPHVEV